MNYNEFRFLYPPRAEVKTKPALISQYDTVDYIGQPKFNGDCTTIIINNDGDIKVFDRDGTPKVKYDKTIDFGALNKSGWMVLCGEMMTKSKKGEDGNILT